MTRITAFLALLFLGFTLSAAPVRAQDETPDEERSYLVGLLEDQLSTPNRQIRLNNIQGALSSNATIGEITIADREGVWLRIVNARIDWSRRSLLLGRLQIASLSADSIDVSRKPLPDESALPSAESSGPFQVPELPLSVNLDELNVPRVTFGPTVFGLASELSITGRLNLSGGSLDTQLQVNRLDGPGGQLALTANFNNSSRVLGLDFRLSEPANGIVANLLDLPNRPPVDLVLAGQGPLEQYDVSLTLDANQQRILTGRTSLRRQDIGLGFQSSLNGPIAALIPERFRAFFGQNTRLEASGVAKDSGGFRLDGLNLSSAALNLTAQAETAADGFLQRLTLDAKVDNNSAEKILLPVPGQNTIDRAELTIGFGDSGSDQWSGKLDVGGLATESFSARSVALTFDGLAQNLRDAAQRRVSFNVQGGVTGIDAPTREVAQALGSEITLDVAGDWRANQPVALERARLAGNGLSVALDGAIADYVFNGNIAVAAQSLVPFSALAGRDLAGGLDLKAQGSVSPIGGGFNLTLDGTGNGLAIGTEQADALLKGTTRLTGGVARGTDGFVARQFTLANDQVQLKADGRIATGAADFNFEAALADLGLVSDQASGRVTATGRAQGADGTIRLALDASVPSGRLMGKSLTQARIGFEGVQLTDLLDGNLTGDAFLDGNRVDLAAGIGISDTLRKLSGFRFNAGGASITGDIQQTVTNGLFDGRLSVDANDVSTIAALALTPAKGSVQAVVNLRTVNGNQDGDVKASVRNLEVAEARVGSADVDAAFSDLFKVIGGNATISATDVAAGGLNVTRLSAQARQNADTTDFSADAALDIGTTARVSGALSRVDTGFRVNLSELALNQRQTTARLLQPTALTIIGQTITIDGLALDVGGGRIDANGRIADTIDLDVAIARLPLAIANTVVPNVEAGGTLDGTVKVTGPRAQPDVNFDIRGQSLTAAALKKAGLQSLGVTATGRSQGETLTLNAALTSPEGLNARAEGTVPLGQNGNLGVDVTLGAFPLRVLNAIAPGQDLGGNVTGTARVTGKLADPAATFNLSGSGITAAPLAQNGLAPLSLRAEGAFREQVLTLNSATVDGPQGLTLRGSGRVPVSGAGLAVNVDGQAPLALANRFLADRGTQFAGTVALNANVTGSIAQPSIQGRVTSNGAAVVDPETNLRVNNIAVAIGLSGDTVNIENISGAIAGGGTVSANGSVSIAGNGFPGNIAISLNNARYADGEMLVATLNGRITVTGALAQDPRIAGQIDVARAEITVPESFGGGAAALDVKHIRPSRAVAETLKRAKANDGTPMPTSRPSVATLDVTVNAPNQVFVRGRGLDAELGGSVRLTGPVTNIQPVGGLDLIRGRISILGQRITFDEGRVSLIGDLDPYLNFVARSEGSDITVFITVEGRASDIKVTFSSQPELPQDEVLARLIFNRGINELSAFQVAQLAAAAAELAGGGNNSLLNNLRAGTGLDDLDIVTDSQGNAAVRAGRYIQDNIYLGVEAGAGGNTKGTINLDITKDLKVKGAVGTQDSSVGVFYERDY